MASGLVAVAWVMIVLRASPSAARRVLRVSDVSRASVPDNLAVSEGVSFAGVVSA